MKADAIKHILVKWREKPDSDPGWRDWIASEAEAELAAIEAKREADILVAQCEAEEKTRRCDELAARGFGFTTGRAIAERIRALPSAYGDSP